MDKSTPIGLVLGLAAMLLAFIMEGGNPVALANPSAALIVFGGTIAATLTAVPLARVLKIGAFLGKAMTERSLNPRELVDLFVRLAEKARREGLLALEAELGEVSDPFLRKGVMLVVDGTDPDLVREIMETELAAEHERHEAGYSVFELMGGFSPTMGIIGTVLGLINVLSNLEDPSELGHAISVAFIATLYGVATANLIWLPLGQKLKNKSKAEAANKEMMLEGILAVQAGDNPRIVRERLEAMQAPSQRAKPEAAAPAEGAAQPAGYQAA